MSCSLYVALLADNFNVTHGLEMLRKDMRFAYDIFIFVCLLNWWAVLRNLFSGMVEMFLKQ